MGNDPIQRRDYASILDLTLATSDIKNKIVHWKVSEDESLSDHNYIIFKLSDKKYFLKQKNQTNT